MPNSEEKLLSTLESDIERVEQTLQQLDSLAAESLDTAEMQSRIHTMMNEFETGSADQAVEIVPSDQVENFGGSDLPGDRGISNQDNAFTQGE